MTKVKTKLPTQKTAKPKTAVKTKSTAKSAAKSTAKQTTTKSGKTTAKPKATATPPLSVKSESTAKPKVVATYRGVEVLDAPHLGPQMIANMADGKYERREVLCALLVIEGADRVVEMGAGAGVVGAIAAMNCKPEKIVAFEGNHQLIDHIDALYVHNGLADTIEVRNQIVLSQTDAPKDVPFFIRGNFLGSGMEIVKGKDRAKEVSVPVATWDEVKSEVSPTILLMDIEGAEREFFRDADLGGIRAIIVELHRHIYQREGMKDIRQTLGAKGFRQDSENSGGGVFIFRAA